MTRRRKGQSCSDPEPRRVRARHPGAKSDAIVANRVRGLERMLEEDRRRECPSCHGEHGRCERLEHAACRAGARAAKARSA
jgi:hypothetical protein